MSKKINLYVSYYSKRNTDVDKISISLYPPKWFDGPQIKEFAPNYETFKTKDYNEYKEKYFTQLDNFSFEDIKKIIYEHSDGFKKDIALCCYEALKKEGEWCHRTMFMEYINEKYGTEVKEL